ncbi:MAG: HAD family hydrolase [Methylobacter sp.]
MTSAVQKSISNPDLDRLVRQAFPQFVELERKIAVAEAVSFDFFDTLFVRPLLNPEDVFDILGKRFGINDFRTLRRAAQTEAFRRMQDAGLKEITLAGIYACFDQLAVPSEELMLAEYELELSLVHPNIELIELFLKTVASGKMVVLTSDMYLPVEFFHEAFRLNSLPAVPMFVSASSNATKRDKGELFNIVAAKLGLAPERILHIGDNPQSDVHQAKAKGLATFHYKEYRSPPQLKHSAPEASLARGLLRKHGSEIEANSYKELGFLYGGPAAVGFLDWITAQARRDNIDRVLFLARDGYILERIAKSRADSQLPPFNYFLGSRVAFTLAAMTEANFAEFLPFLVSGAEGLSPYELLARIGVHPPANKVMENFGLGAEIRITHSRLEPLREFLYAYRWEILKVCRANRRALFAYLNSLGIQSGNRIALVDVGWSGTTQDAFEMAIQNIIDITVFGYYFCLADTQECLKRRRIRRMSALISSSSTSAGLVDRIYENRAVVEMFFSAPHQSVIGLTFAYDGRIVATEDIRKASAGNLAQISTDLVAGMESFACSFERLREQLRLPTSPLDVAMPLIEFITKEDSGTHELLASVKNFDGWSLTGNRNTLLIDY